MKKIIAICLILSVVAIFISGCEQKDKTQSSSLTVAEQSSYETSTSSSVKTTISRPEKTSSETGSSSTSSDIKQYKKNDGLMLGCIDFNPSNCTFWGESNGQKLDEFKTVVKEGYFNTYFLSLDETFMEAARIVAEAGASIWITPSKYESDSDVSLSEQGETLDIYINMLKKEGLYGIVNGFFWDAPIWTHKYSNKDLLSHTEYLYKEYGLRNYIILKAGEFWDVITSVTKKPPFYVNYSMDEYDENYQISPEALKYVTDVGHWFYTMDVRESANYSQQRIDYFKDYILSDDIVDVKSCYTESAKMLKAHIGHKVNFWYSSLCQECVVFESDNGKEADEEYCIAHLEFMVQNLLQEENAGGIALYGYRDKNYAGFSLHNDIVDENGEYMFILSQYNKPDKYLKYCKLLRDTTVKFNSAKPTLVKLDV